MLKKSANFRKKRYVDAVFFGELINGKRHGKGIMKYKSGRVFEGDWQNDLRHGRGYERYENGNIYIGDFDTGKAHGHGNYSWRQSGEVYDGEWTRGVRHGYGVWRNQRGDSYIGEWRHGKAIGYGVFTWNNGDKYEGEWHANLKHGKGADYFINGDTYRGEYKTGKPDGFGVYTWANGCTYEGHFKCGLKFGKGKWKKAPEQPGAPGNEYNGEYLNDKKCGQGEFKWASGNIYRGQYKDDEREGHGEMIWTDGSRYIGQWIKGIQHGYGKMIFPDGTMKEGYFENNVFIGPVPSKQMIQKQKSQQSLSQNQQSNGTQKFKTPSKQHQGHFLQRTEKQVSDVKQSQVHYFTNHKQAQSQNHFVQQEKQNSTQQMRQKQISINSNILSEFGQQHQPDKITIERIKSGKSHYSIQNREEGPTNEDYSQSYNVLKNLKSVQDRKYSTGQNNIQYISHRQQQFQQQLLQNNNPSNDHNGISKLASGQPRFLSNQKLKNRLFSPMSQTNLNQIPMTETNRQEKDNILNRYQSQQVLKTIQKPKIVDKDQNQILTKIASRELQEADNNEGSDQDDDSDGREVLFEGKKYTKKLKKRQSKSNRNQKSISQSSSKQLFQKKVPQIRFQDSDYYFQTQQYNLGLS